VKTPNPSQQYQHLTSAETVLLFKSGLGGAAAPDGLAIRSLDRDHPEIGHELARD
jgi:hypothetical protein